MEHSAQHQSASSAPPYTYVAIDLKSFYASVECVERGLDPLTTNLVVADPSRTDKTICLAVSPSLKKYGLSGRSRLFEVHQVLADLRKRTGKTVPFITAPPRMSLYMQYSGRIYAIYLKYVSPEDIHVYSIDECFLDVSRYLALYHTTARQLTRTILQDVLKTTGITGTAGIGTNLYLCKIAMDIMAKHAEADADGTRIGELDETSYKYQLWDHRPLTDFWRIGRGTAGTLEKRQIFTMGDLARASIDQEEWLYQTFGIDAELLIDHAWGLEPCTMADIKRYRPGSNSLGSGQVLQSPYPYSRARIIVLEMIDELILELSAKELATDSVTLHIGYDRSGGDLPGTAHGTANLKTPSSSPERIRRAGLDLYDRIVDPSRFVRRVTVTANRVVPDNYLQFDLFSDPEKLEKEKNLQRIILEIRKKYGKNAILKGTSLQDGATARERHQQIGGHRA